MLYNKDPIMPFQHADYLKYAGQSDDDDDVNEYDSDATEICAPTDNHGLQSTIEHLENQHKHIFDKAHKSINKAQIHQAKGYNNWKAKGKPFEIGTCVLKRNLAQLGHKGPKLCRPFTRPYMVIGRSSSGYFLKDQFSHWLSRSVPSSHLVCFYENATYKTNSDNSKLDVDVESTCSSNEQSDSNDDSGFNWESKHKGQFCQ